MPGRPLDKHHSACNYRSMIWLALAAQMSIPIPVGTPVADISSLFSSSDFPKYLVEAGADISRTVYTRTTVRPDGSTENCLVEVTSGDPRLDAYTCALIVKRANFHPATWTDGSAVYGVIRAPIRWRMAYVNAPEEDPLKSGIPDLELSVNQLPKGARSIVSVTLELAADENGRAVACMEKPPTKNDWTKHFPELVPIACAQAVKKITIKAPSDAAGKPLRSVQNASRSFQA